MHTLPKPWHYLHPEFGIKHIYIICSTAFQTIKSWKESLTVQLKYLHVFVSWVWEQRCYGRESFDLGLENNLNINFHSAVEFTG